MATNVLLSFLRQNQNWSPLGMMAIELLPSLCRCGLLREEGNDENKCIAIIAVPHQKPGSRGMMTINVLSSLLCCFWTGHYRNDDIRAIVIILWVRSILGAGMMAINVLSSLPCSSVDGLIQTAMRMRTISKKQKPEGKDDNKWIPFPSHTHLQLHMKETKSGGYGVRSLAYTHQHPKRSYTYA